MHHRHLDRAFRRLIVDTLAGLCAGCSKTTTPPRPVGRLWKKPLVVLFFSFFFFDFFFIFCFFFFFFHPFNRYSAWAGTSIRTGVGTICARERDGSSRLDWFAHGWGFTQSSNRFRAYPGQASSFFVAFAQLPDGASIAARGRHSQDVRKRPEAAGGVQRRASRFRG